MNRMLLVVFDNEKSAEQGHLALRQLHALGGLTLYALGVVAKDDKGKLSVREHTREMPAATGVGLAVGALIGLLGGPAGMAAGAVTGALVGAVRDFWMAGVGLDFVEEAALRLQPGAVALVAEVEEEWVAPVDARMAECHGVVYRHARSLVAEEQVERDVLGLRADMAALETELKQATGHTRTALSLRITTAQAQLEAAVHRARAGARSLQDEADAKLHTLQAQLVRTKGDVKARLQARELLVRTAYAERSAKLAKAWGLTRDALSA